MPVETPPLALPERQASSTCHRTPVMLSRCLLGSVQSTHQQRHRMVRSDVRRPSSSVAGFPTLPASTTTESHRLWGVRRLAGRCHASGTAASAELTGNGQRLRLRFGPNGFLNLILPPATLLPDELVIFHLPLGWRDAPSPDSGCLTETAPVE